MLSFFSRLVLASFLAFISSAAFSAPNLVEATGQALIQNNNLGAAREHAITDAKQQASLQAAAFISSTQQVDNGILEIDNMRVSTSGAIRNVEILEEKLLGNKLFVRIRAEVDVQLACPNGNSGNSFRKSVAVTAFSLQFPSQASLGGFQTISSSLASELTNRLRKHQGITALNAGNVTLFNNLDTASTHQLPHGALSNVVMHSQTLDTQYVISGIVRDLSMQNPEVINETNWLVDLYNRQDFKSDKHLRNFAVDIYIHDGFSGNLISQKNYTTQGMWLFKLTEKPGFATPAFNQSDYGQKIHKLFDQVDYDLSKEFRCLPFSARITQTQGNLLWINAGRTTGIKRGDKLSVYRKSMLYNPDGSTTTELINTRLSLIIDNVQAHSSKGRLNSSAAENNIQPDDLVMFW